MNFYAVVLVFRLIVTLTLILCITPQTSVIYYNYVIETVHSSGIFLNYPDAKKFVFRFTWICIFLYLVLNGILSFL